MSEFSIIKQYFENLGGNQADVILGIGDDAALVKTDAVLAVSVDTFIENVHFPDTTAAYDIGWKSLAVNLSDMAAMGAQPCWMTLAITMPTVDHAWLKEYCRGLSVLASQYNVALIGGDTTRGPLSITIQIFGRIVSDKAVSGKSTSPKALCRGDAQTGDAIYVTGQLGDGALGLRSLNQNLDLSVTEKNRIQQKLNRPQPRIDEIAILKQYVNAAIDISDGLYADLGHILVASHKGAIICVNDIPLSAEYRRVCQGVKTYDLALIGGDDYELCLTVSVENEPAFLAVASDNQFALTKIGDITEEQKYRLVTGQGEEYHLESHAFEHFN